MSTQVALAAHRVVTLVAEIVSAKEELVRLAAANGGIERAAINVPEELAHQFGRLQYLSVAMAAAVSGFDNLNRQGELK